ncbi:interferon-induced GTP-binding protein Mx3-like isoform X1 [Pristis pectinata]|uniref:interferon-induced GTP-binding protein Mx3-like isoform X1 n=1 Tax=Pristis pectinata TaxID=685728 RepID=UPI00223D5443|nr:interferon-induced GTP-binding protein Mx3-like isoform X1 [Pristis pectinata]XP_051870970.1 interferon-induced GTP-binding protein Mx3-like isoform X1 [Pristis pectinata]XP_051870971.1 interferon-induced GTP-binding protein Mx3-like isoform X1 [Pristis pectinata]XP_051870972.1 interferon-induced GTP-binding protein Mx3-like isoform X1 [Pristis pectinata]XP_051870973.1 interferon-induced GTP-binding protein Mx3-like isoform X2 [Pristis pectinata]XP_051870974.1 interferon-induced GTP-binding
MNSISKNSKHHKSRKSHSSRRDTAGFKEKMEVDYMVQTDTVSFGQHVPNEVQDGVNEIPVPNGDITNSTKPGFQNDVWLSAFGVAEARQEQKEQKSISVKAMRTSLSNQYEQEVRPCIDLIDSLRGFGVDKDLGLPAIAVIGDQSSGKSSVLEALSGVSLPRGSGIVTRCPLELKLKNVKAANVWKGKISYKDYSNKLSSTTQVEEEILKAQNSIAGQGVGISHELISLEIESTNVPDLTLIDLPGIARVAVGGQPQDIGDQIKRLIKSFIQKQETINLVVVPCNVDIATTEALKMAREVDPSGDRTLGILTKPDLVDKGTEVNVVEIVKNMVVELSKGYMVVKCRGQRDINDKITMEDAIMKEKAFFEDHEQFRQLLEEGKAGIPNLAVRLTKELVNHIHKSLPQLRIDVEKKLNKSLQSLKEYSCAVPTSYSEKMTFIIEKINNFCSHTKNVTLGVEPYDKTKGERFITRVRREFEKWNSFLKDSVSNFQEYIREEVLQYEDRYRGRELPGFVNYKTFESLIKNEIAQLEEPAIEKMKTITEITREAFMDIAEQHFSAFCNLFKAAKVKIATLSCEQEREAEKLLQAQFKIESVVYSQDSLYSHSLGILKSNKFGLFGNASIQEMSYHLQAYYKIASNRLADQIPMVIRCYILNEIVDKLRIEMLQILQDRDRINEYLSEDHDTQRKRETLKCRIDRLRKAQKILLEFG